MAGAIFRQNGYREPNYCLTKFLQRLQLPLSRAQQIMIYRRSRGRGRGRTNFWSPRRIPLFTALFTPTLSAISTTDDDDA